MKVEARERVLDTSMDGALRVPVIESNHKLFRVILVLLLVTIDLVAAGVALAICRYYVPTGLPHTLFSTRALAAGIPLGLVLLFWINGLYSSKNFSGGAGEYGGVFRSLNILLPVVLLTEYLAGILTVNVASVLGLYLALLGCLVTGRFLTRRLSYVLRHYPQWRQRTLIIGACSEGCAVARQWEDIPAGVEVVGFLDDDLKPGRNDDLGIDIVGRTAELEWAIKRYRVDCVLIADPAFLRDHLEHDDHILETLSKVEVFAGTGASELLNSGTYIREEGFIPLVVLGKNRVTGLHSMLKTALDYTITILCLIALCLFVPFLGLLIRLESPGPVVYKHRRIGLHRKAFYAYKFRSMFVDGNDRLSEEQKKELAETMKLKDDPRITRIGKFLRKTSLDELPQLFNVLFGQMSLVGPRPVVEHESEKFGRWQNLRATVKPGLTGLWQVSGRSDLSYEERVRLDVYYVRNHTIWLDLKILIQTLPALLFRRGAY